MTLFLKIIVPTASAVLLGLAVMHLAQTTGQERILSAPPVAPPAPPFRHAIAACGLVEASAGDIKIGSPATGVVAEVFVAAEQDVEAGDKLLRLDDRELQAELKTRRAEVESARAELTRLGSLPRPEALPPLEAQVAAADVQLLKAKDRRDRLERSKEAVSGQNVTSARHDVSIAEAELERVRAELRLVRAGASEAEIGVARAALDAAVQRAEQCQARIEMLTIRAPAKGRILQVNVAPGESVSAVSQTPLLVLCDVSKLCVRVELDEYDVPRFQREAPAYAVVKGHAEISIPVSFDHLEPVLVPQQSLTGFPQTRVDTRVLHAFFAVSNPDDVFLYVGQQLDVFIQYDDKESVPRPDSRSP